MDTPETRYAKTPDGLSIAYQTLGEGPTDVAFIPVLACIDVMWEEPSYADALCRLANIGRLICFDRRGFGASDPVPLAALPTPEEWMDDLRVVLDEVGSTSVSVVCHGKVGYMGMLFAATYPERTNALILLDSSARTYLDEDYPSGIAEDVMGAALGSFLQEWGTPSSHRVAQRTRVFGNGLAGTSEGPRVEP
jgi:pimeloyl-ACP methyl ester carboxylesterase